MDTMLKSLFKACKVGDNNTVTHILNANKYYVNRTIDEYNYEEDIDYRSPAICTACKYGHLNIVKNLLQNGAFINAEDYNNIPKVYRLPLVEASENGHFEIVKYLIKCGANPNGYIRTSSLFYACEHGYLDIVKYLIQNGADVYFSGCAEEVLPIEVACLNRHSEVVKYLQPLCTRIEPTRLLFLACGTGDVESVKYLTKNGANINHCNIHDDIWVPNPTTPLIKACACGYLEIVKYLIDSGVDVNYINQTYDPHDIKKFADSYKDSWQNATALIAACYNGELDVVIYLIEKGANINYIYKRNFDCIDITPLMAASMSNNLDIVKYLISKKANIDYHNYDCDSAYMIAYREGYWSIVDYFEAIGYKEYYECRSKYKRE